MATAESRLLDDLGIPPPKAPLFECESWAAPPPGCRDSNGKHGCTKPFYVDIRVIVDRLANVDTVEGSASVAFYLVFYWTDTRLIDWPNRDHLPPKLWTPFVVWRNYLERSDDVFENPNLSDPASGRVHMRQNIQGKLDNPMSLASFPFDADAVSIKLWSGIQYRTADGNTSGQQPRGPLYTVRPVDMSTGVQEGNFLRPDFHAKISEWRLHGMSTRFDNIGPLASGVEPTELIISFHLTRKWRYYFWKALLPLYLLTILAFGTFEIPVDNIPARNDSVATYFLAAFAMLYVVDQTLPKTDFLTQIDTIIVLTTCMLLALGIATVVLYRISLTDQDYAELWNLRLEVGLFVFYWLVNLIMFIPAYLRQRAVIEALETDDEDDTGMQATSSAPEVTERFGFDDASSIPIVRDRTDTIFSVTSRDFQTKAKKTRPTVHKDAHYITWNNLLDMAVQNWGD